jgi:thiopurine S-methyltransferase
MTPEFWHGKWQRNEIGFHEGRPNHFLVKHAGRLDAGAGSRVFLPLCGKTRDIAWLMERGARVAGAELNRGAIEQLFAELELAPEVTAAGPLERFSAPGIDVFVGDVFALTPAQLGPVDAIYDRAALVALPAEVRRRYAGHLRGLTGTARQLLISYEYDQSLAKGPPFSVPADEVHALYGDGYRVQEVETAPVERGLKGLSEVVERIWQLTPRQG